MKQFPPDPDIARGDSLRDSGALDEAVAAYLSITIARPDYPLAHFKLGTVYERQGKKDQAEACYRRALNLAANYAQAANNLALLLAGRGEVGEAEGLYRQALAESVDYYEAHLNLADLLIATGRPTEALYYSQRALSLQPDSALAKQQLGGSLIDYGRITEAMDLLNQSLSLTQNKAATWANLGRCHMLRGNMEASEECCRKALDIDPSLLPTWHNLLLASNYSQKDRAEVFQLHQSFGEYMASRAKASRHITYDNPINPDRRLRIGFLSSDLRRHSVSHFIEGPLRHLDPARFEAWAYYGYQTEDYRSQELKPLFHRWKNIFRVKAEEVAEQIRLDRIDILVDLSGHTGGNRLDVLALKPAPIQVSWIGYPNTTGLQTMDYRIVDALTDPPGDADNFYSETLLRLPQSFLCYTPPKEAPELAPPPCLKSGKVTFGSFNTRTKVGKSTLGLWKAVLDAVPGSDLVIKSVGGLRDQEEREDFLLQLETAGIHRNRISLYSVASSLVEHLEQYSGIDICLDTFPYHGTTTTCEALWMGVPVVSLVGDRHASRVGLSLLSNANLVDLIAKDAADFVRISSELAADKDRLTSLRTGMRDRLAGSPLLNAIAAARNLESGFQDIWKRWCEKQVASTATVTALADTGQALDSGCRRLNIGGTTPKEGWKILNAMPGVGVDYLGDIRNLDMFESNSIEEIYASHVLEHVNQQEILPTLKGIHRILVPGGKFYISVPDLDVLCHQFHNPRLEMPQRFHLMRMMFGGQTDAFDYHYIGLNLEFLVNYLQNAGFYSLEQVENLDLFEDTSCFAPHGVPISLNLIAIK